MTEFKVPPEVVPGVWRIVLAWTCVYVLSDGRDFSLLDTGTIRDRSRLLAALGALSLDPAHCRSVLLTHGHCDHAGNAAYFAETHGAKVHAHHAERQFLETRRTYVPRDIRALGPQGWMYALGEVCFPVRRRLLDAALQEADMVDTPAGQWRVVHTPGHTPGHTCYYREADGVLLAGDALLTIVPFILTEALAVPTWIFNTDTCLARQSVRRIRDLQPRALLPGHGRPLVENTAARIAEFADSLRD